MLSFDSFEESSSFPLDTDTFLGLTGGELYDSSSDSTPFFLLLVRVDVDEDYCSHEDFSSSSFSFNTLMYVSLNNDK